jgi:hypothetical protein
LRCNGWRIAAGSMLNMVPPITIGRAGLCSETGVVGQRGHST